MAYETVLLKLRHRYHARVARWLESNAGDRLAEFAGLIAEHYTRAKEFDHAAAYWERAGDAALKTGDALSSRDAFDLAIEAASSASDSPPDPGLSLKLGRSLMQLGEFERALHYTRRQIELEPLKEDAHEQLIRILALSGRRSEALSQYDALRQTLARELDIKPTKETIALYELIRSGEMGVVERPPARPPVVPSLPPAFLEEESQQRTNGKPVFVARERELSRLDALLGLALSGRGRVVFVTGGAGRGKSALLREFVQRSLDAYPELLVAEGHCTAYSGVGDPYSPFREIMSM